MVINIVSLTLKLENIIWIFIKCFNKIIRGWMRCALFGLLRIKRNFDRHPSHRDCLLQLLRYLSLSLLLVIWFLYCRFVLNLFLYLPLHVHLHSHSHPHCHHQILHQHMKCFERFVMLRDVDWSLLFVHQLSLPLPTAHRILYIV